MSTAKWLVAILSVGLVYTTACSESAGDDGAGGAGGEEGEGGEDGEGGEASGEPCYPTTLEGACDPASVTFTLDSTNLYYPLVVGDMTVLEGMEDGELIRIERTVLNETEMVGGVETHVLEHREYADGVMIEVARNFYVEATNGTVCYFGEDVDNYEDGVLANNDGSWRVGIDGAEPGIIMPANPTVGDAYFQENAPGIAVDMGRVAGIGETVMLSGTEYMDLVHVEDSNPMETCDEEETKLYAPGIGEVADSSKQLIMFTPGS